jgi:glycosyltransferase involved in cell wall biosynthesis
MKKPFSLSELNRPLIIVCNGPSASRYSLADFPKGALVFRMNHFYKEEIKRYGVVVDGFFAAVDHKFLYDNIADIAENGTYSIRRYFNPLSLDHRAFADRRLRYKQCMNEFIDHWAIFSRCPRAAQLLKLRPLPTQGIQALATALELGFRHIYVVGMDLYANASVRYSWTYSDSEIEQLGTRHAKPGYEEGAHTLDADLRFLDVLLDEYREAHVTFLSDNPQVVQRSRGSGAGWLEAQVMRLRRSCLRRANHHRLALQRIVERNHQLQRLVRLGNIILRRRYDVGFILNENLGKVGSPKPVHNYVKHGEGRRRRFKVYQLCGMNSRLKMLLMRLECKTIVINGLKAFEDANIFLLKRHARDVYVYLHETKYVFDRWHGEFPQFWDDTREFLRQAKLLCVSRLQKDYLEHELGVGFGAVIYNSIVPYSGYSYDFARPTECRNIIMVGTRQARKGVDLFSQTADLARSKGIRCRFVWVGGKDCKDTFYFSDNVTWVPNQEDRILDVLLRDAHVLFLSSVDDPFPLVCLEAIAKGLRVVVYKGTGTAELAAALDTLQVYDEYSPQGALAAIERAIARECVADQYQYINHQLSSVGAFSSRLETAIGISHA